MADVTTPGPAGAPRLFRRRPGAFEPTLAVGVGLAAWYVAGLVATRLPMPHEILVAAVELLLEPSSYPEFAATLRRMGLGLLGGFLLGASVGIAMGARPLADGFFRPWVVLALAIPEPVVIIACVLILGIKESTLMIALIISLAPYVAVVTNAGMKAIDLKLVEMSEVFNASWRQTWTQVILPQTVPALFAGLRTGFALSWKLVVVLEAIAASTGVGSAMLFSFRQLEAAEMVAWGLILGIVMWIVEVQGFRRVERRLSRWRG
jgi:NitT/TauT family transport system permease protein